MTGAGSADVVQVGPPVTDASGAVELEIIVAAGWYLFAPGSQEGLPLRVTCAGSDLPWQLRSTGGALAGRFVVTVPAPADGHLDLHVQACNGAQCLRPAVLPLLVPTGTTG